MNKVPAKILIVEDNDVIRQMMAQILTNAGYETFEAADGNEGIEQVLDIEPDMALVDLNMDPMGGFEFVEYLRARDNMLPVAIITGEKSSDILTRASALGVAHMVQKPIQPDRLLKIVEHVLRSRPRESHRL